MNAAKFARLSGFCQPLRLKLAFHLLESSSMSTRASYTPANCCPAGSDPVARRMAAAAFNTLLVAKQLTKDG